MSFSTESKFSSIIFDRISSSFSPFLRSPLLFLFFFLQNNWLYWCNRLPLVEFQYLQSNVKGEQYFLFTTVLQLFSFSLHFSVRLYLHQMKAFAILFFSVSFVYTITCATVTLKEQRSAIMKRSNEPYLYVRI